MDLVSPLFGVAGTTEWLNIPYPIRPTLRNWHDMIRFQLSAAMTMCATIIMLLAQRVPCRPSKRAFRITLSCAMAKLIQGFLSIGRFTSSFRTNFLWIPLCPVLFDFPRPLAILSSPFLHPLKTCSLVLSVVGQRCSAQFLAMRRAISRTTFYIFLSVFWVPMIGTHVVGMFAPFFRSHSLGF